MAPIIVAITTMLYYPKKSSNYNFRKIFFVSVIASIGSSLLVSDNSLLSQGENNKLL
jgi:ABC-type transport system involved in cytochrome c biogenesis permease subunit